MQTILKITYNTPFFKKAPSNIFDVSWMYDAYIPLKIGECVEMLASLASVSGGYLAVKRLNDNTNGFVWWESCEVLCTLANNTLEEVMVEGRYLRSMSEFEKQDVIRQVSAFVLFHTYEWEKHSRGNQSKIKRYEDLFPYLQKVVDSAPCEDLAYILVQFQQSQLDIFAFLIKEIDDDVLMKHPTLVVRMVAMLPHTGLVSFIFNIINFSYNFEIAHLAFKKIISRIPTVGKPLYSILPNNVYDDISKNISRSDNIYVIETNTKAILRMKIFQIRYYAQNNDVTQLKSLFFDFFEMLDMVMELLMRGSKDTPTHESLIVPNLFYIDQIAPHTPFDLAELWNMVKRADALPTLILINDGNVTNSEEKSKLPQLVYNKITHLFETKEISPTSPNTMHQDTKQNVNPCNPLSPKIDKKKFIAEIVVSCASAFHKFLYNDFQSVVENEYPHLIPDINRWLKEEFKPRIYDRLSSQIKNNPNVKGNCKSITQNATILDMARIWFWELGSALIGEKDEENNAKQKDIRKLTFGATSDSTQLWQQHIVIKEVQKILDTRLSTSPDNETTGFVIQAKFDVPSFWNALKSRDLPFIQAGSFSVEVISIKASFKEEPNDRVAKPIEETEKVRIRIFNGMHLESATRFARDNTKPAHDNKVGVVYDRPRNAPEQLHLIRLGGNLNLYYEWTALVTDITKPL